MTNKKILRNKLKNIRKELNIKEKSILLCEKLKKTDEYKNSKHIMIFYPLENEINLLDLTKDHSKKFYLPKICGKDLLCCPFNNEKELCVSCFKIKEPTSNPVEKSLIDLIIVPALGVDKNNHRLGYGGGFYDRFLNGINANKIVCIPEELIVDSIYPEKHDIKIDKIIIS